MALNEVETPVYNDEYKQDIIKKKKPYPSMFVERSKLDLYKIECILIITIATDIEKWAVIDCLDPPDITDRNGKQLDKSVDLYEPNWIVLGKYGGYAVAVVQTEMGNDARDEISTAVGIFPNAKYIIAIGMCYSAKHKKGDIMVSKWIDGVSNLKFTKDVGIIIRASSMRYSQTLQRLQNIFARGLDTWITEEDFSCSEEGRKPVVKAGCIISAPLLVDNAHMRDLLQASSPEAIAGEMEGVKVIEVAKEIGSKRDLSAIVIKGVADHADGSKDKVWQLTAALGAARYARHKLAETAGYLKEHEQ